ncbi:Hexose transporter 2 [Pseudocercospora fuligena]|uniref:Hexose transporter 2 n=1 Tax=Pseudocercospora fuligena TaxID=685502 RepID=A0A8H6RN26_9PEZI|nr:Hexose transporter 2 [Pseudocercospora fuligena]
MPFLKRTEREAQHANQLEKAPSPAASGQRVTFAAVFLGLVASIGGFMFGYVSGQISGFFQMDDYAQRFGQLQSDGSYTFSAARQGTITGILCVGCLFGALIAGKIADTLGRKMSISVSAFFSLIGTVIEVSSMSAWYQFAIGRLVNGFGIGALSVLVPMYQSESSPAIIRGLLVASYQLFITLGIWTAEMIDWGTSTRADTGAWRIPNAISLLWGIILGFGILFLPESPRFAYKRGRVDECRKTLAKLGGLDPEGREVNILLTEIRVKHEEEVAAGEAKWFEIFTAPKMFYRTVLGIVLQAGQQLTGANFFFYYGTTIFKATGLENSFVTQIILGSVNVFCTFIALYIVQKSGRRNALMIGAAWIFMCFMVYAFVGHFALDSAHPENTPAAGSVLIVFSCLAIAAFATTWGPLVWAVVGELYPMKYRGPCMALATASNWLWNFLISFFTRFITDAIDYFYGFVFAGCCAALVAIVFFFMIETKDRSLEEIDTMYVLGVNPITSAKWDGSKLPVSADTSGRNSSDAAHAERNASVASKAPTETLEE